MAKLVILSEGMTGRSHELKVEKTTIGRVEDNTFQIAEPSVSSHHCEVLMRGTDVIVRDLNSTNGCFINGEKVTERLLKPGQTLRVGQIEMRLETDAPPGQTKKSVDSTMVVPRGVSLNQLEQGSRAAFDTAGKGFSKKDNKANKIFLIGAVAVGLIVVVLLIIAFFSVRTGAP